MEEYTNRYGTTIKYGNYSNSHLVVIHKPHQQPTAFCYNDDETASAHFELLKEHYLNVNQRQL